MRDHATALAQSAFALGDVERNRLVRQAAEIWAQIESLEQQRTRLEMEPSEPAQIHRELRAKLPEIDFEALEQALRKILDAQWDDGCAVLLLFQQSVKMGGEWCAARIRELLSRQTNPGCFRYYPVEFQPGGHIDNMAPLRRIGDHLGLDPPAENAQTFARLIAGKLCGSLQMGSVILLELRRCDYLADVPGILTWLIEHFWRPLLQELAAVAHEVYGVKIIALLFVDADLPLGTFPADVCCTLDQFERRHVLEMTLCAWTRGEIRDWITRFSGLNLPRPAVDLMVDKVYKATDGTPSLVAQQLLELCAPRAIR